MLLLKSPTASASTQVTTLPRISVRTSRGRWLAYSVQSELSDFDNAVDNVGKAVMADR
jgi:hypothetical protein